MRGLHPPYEVPLVKYAAALVVLAALAGCKKKEPEPAPVPVAEPPKPVAAKPSPPKPTLSPPLSAAQQAAIEKTQTREAANDIYVKARDLYRQATESTEEWIEPELGKVTEAQVKDHLGSMLNERGAWVKESASMGKLHK
jgi:hypothetical protein